MRIIGGALRGKKLIPFEGSKIRPTSDRVKEALFNIIAPRLGEGVRVLDLFAGTGNLGIEACSHGAELAVFVEKDREAAGILKRNLESCRFEGKTEVIQRDVLSAIGMLEERGITFDLVFIDPPYGKGLIEETMARLADSPVASGAVIIAEHARRDDIGEHYGRFGRYDSRRYGDTSLSFFSEESSD